MLNETNELITLARTKLAGLMNSEGKLAVVESYARVLNQLLEAKQREVNIEHTQKQISKTSS